MVEDRSLAPPKIARVFGWLALLALVATIGWGLRMGAGDHVLETRQAPRGGLSLQFALTATAADAIRTSWGSNADLFRTQLRRDSVLIALYTLTFLLAVVWSGLVTDAARGFMVFLAALALFGGVADLIENWMLAIPFGWESDAVLSSIVPDGRRAWAMDPSLLYVHAVTAGRVASMTKFVLLLFAGAGTLALAGGAWRKRALLRRPNRGAELEQIPVPAVRPGDPPTLRWFREMIRRETDGIFSSQDSRSPDVPRIVDSPAADEPRVLFRAADVIGLALSGGGIRSATFNLGLLEGLHRVNLLPLFDYLSTVSGGGYVGSFWSAWIVRRPGGAAGGSSATLFPSHRDAGSDPQDRIDTPQERHLREFSGFLAPRWGFFEVEMWTALVALISGLLPALATGLAIIGVVMVGWLSLTFSLAYDTRVVPVIIVGAITVAMLYLFERMWHEVKTASSGSLTGTGAPVHADKRLTQLYRFLAAAAVLLVLLLQYSLPLVYSRFGATLPLWSSKGGWSQAPGDGAFDQWWAVAGISRPDAWVFSPHLFDFAMVWLAAALLMVGARLAYPIWPFIAARSTLASFDRVLMRLLGLSVVWIGLALLWHLAMNLDSLVKTIVAAAISGGVFAALRNWIGVALRRPSQPGTLDRLKPYLPQLLAYLTIVLAAAAMGQLLIAVCGTDWLAWWCATAIMLSLMLMALFITPSEYGLHAFYRERISRAYSGACNIALGAHAGSNRRTEPQPEDDQRLATLAPRPLHLVCCAANDLSGDPLETLARGSRSAVLSRHGFSVGRFWAPVKELRLGSAVTASAAAFNSNMGRISMEVGPAVSFLMTALNLRLGLWLRHPRASAEGPRRWPGLLLYREMFGLTTASGTVVHDRLVPRLMRDVHLSDGGHFENLALYELVRRHCRYILMSDCGADPTVAFDDLGNAFRRIREDFGVDISLDIAPIRPDANGWSRQHIAVGTIHYSATDRGILLYVKPTLTGDEPPDVLQYKTRNTAFPHEGTGDQFYDEAQWESYRRLGLHAAEQIFAFVPPAADPASGAGVASTSERAPNPPPTADWVFTTALHEWGATPEGLVDRILEMTKRFGDLESELQDRQATRGVLAEVYPEIAALALAAKEQGREIAAAAQPGDTIPSAAELSSDLSCLMRVTQLMEDVWMACDLDRSWDHPLNLGWVNLFARWATAPSFRFWWPLFGPMFSPGFRSFLDQRFPTPAPSNVAPDGTHAVAVPSRGIVRRRADNAPPGLAELWWRDRSTQPVAWKDRIVYENILELPYPPGRVVPMQVGLVTVAIENRRVGWTSDDFFVPPSLWGAGIGWYFLDNLLNAMAAICDECYVVVKAPPLDSQHEVAHGDRRSFLEQYPQDRLPREPARRQGRQRNRRDADVSARLPPARRQPSCARPQTVVAAAGALKRNLHTEVRRFDSGRRSPTERARLRRYCTAAGVAGGLIPHRGVRNRQ